MAKSCEQKLVKTERVDWGGFPLGDVFARLGSKRGGLSSEEAKSRLKRFGENVFVDNDKIPASKIFLNVFLSPFFGIAIFSAVSSLFAKMYLESAVVIAVSFFGFLSCFFAKIKIEKYAREILNLDSRYATVWRDGARKKVSFSEIVPGDVISFRSGDEIPADARIIKCFGLKTKEEKITGSKEFTVKSVSAVSSVGSEIAGRSNLVYGGTFVFNGFGEAVVFETGSNLETFKFSSARQKIYFPETLLEKRISKLVKLFSAGVLVLSSAILIFGFVMGKLISESLAIISAFSASAVLPILSVGGFSVLSVGIGKMLSKKYIVRSLSSAEEIGNVGAVILERQNLFSYGKLKIVKILSPERRSGVLELGSTAEYSDNRLLTVTYGSLVFGSSEANSPFVDQVSGGENEMEKVFIEIAVSSGIDIKKIDCKFKRIGAVSQCVSRNFLASFRETPEGERWVFVVGRADALISNIKKIQVLNRYENATVFEIGAVKESINSMSKSGISVFAVCSKKIENMENLSYWFNEAGGLRPVSGLNLVGLVGIKYVMDEDTRRAFSEARRAGIKIVLADQENSLSAKHFANEVGVIHKNKSPEVLEGKEVDTLDPLELSYRARSIDVFSTASGTHKLKIVKAWKATKEKVCAFGNYPDDMDAVSEANVGISSLGGSDIVKNFSGMIAVDGGIESFLEVVKEGKLMSRNIRKVFIYFIGLCFSEAILLGLAVIFGFGVPVFPSQILWANIVVGIFSTAALVGNKSEKEIADLPPHKNKKKLMDAKDLFFTFAISFANAIAMFGLFAFFASSLDSPSYARSITFAALCVNSLFLSFSASEFFKPVWKSSFSDKKKTLSLLGLGVLASVSAVYVFPVRSVLELTPLIFLEWIIVFGIGILMFLAVETAKWRIYKKISNF